MKIAVTGSMGSGKTTVSRMLANALGAELVNSDTLCRQQLRPGKEGMVRFLEVFGEQYLLTDGNIDREKLRQAVFTDDNIKQLLEQILHPIVRREIELLYRSLQNDKAMLVAEVPLLYETSMDSEFEACVVVRVPRETAVLRVTNRDPLVKAEVERILDSQMAIEVKEKLADYVVDNSGTLASTAVQIGWLGEKFKLLTK